MTDRRIGMSTCGMGIRASQVWKICYARQAFGEVGALAKRRTYRPYDHLAHEARHSIDRPGNRAHLTRCALGSDLAGIPRGASCATRLGGRRCWLSPKGMRRWLGPVCRRATAARVIRAGEACTPIADNHIRSIARERFG